MTDALTPPHSLADEQAVLGAVLMDGEALDVVGALLSPADFYARDHAQIYAAMQRLHLAGRAADVLTVFEAVPDADLAYLNELAAGVASSRNVRAYAEVVRERSLRRGLMRMGRALADDALRGTLLDRPVQGLIDRAVDELLALQLAGAAREPRPMDQVLVRFLDDLQARADGAVSTMESGLRDLDRLTAGGGRRGELWVIGARPSMGKTAMVLQLCRRVGTAHQVLLCSQEDSELTAAARCVAAEGRVNLADLRNPVNAPDSMWNGVTDGVDGLRGLNVALDDDAGLTLADVRRKAQQVRRRCKRLDLVIVDYLQLMDGEADNRNLALGQIANGMKRLAKDLDVWVVALSQLSRKADDRPGVPQMSDLRDSGDIEGAADFIGLLHREHMRKPTEENKHWAQLHVAKQKNGPTDTLNLYFDGKVQRFSDWDGPVPLRSKGYRNNGGD